MEKKAKVDFRKTKQFLYNLKKVLIKTLKKQ